MRNSWKNIYIGILKSFGWINSGRLPGRVPKGNIEQKSWTNPQKNSSFIVRFLEEIPTKITGGTVTRSSDKNSRAHVRILQDFLWVFGINWRNLKTKRKESIISLTKEFLKKSKEFLNVTFFFWKSFKLILLGILGTKSNKHSKTKSIVFRFWVFLEILKSFSNNHFYAKIVRKFSGGTSGETL